MDNETLGGGRRNFLIKMTSVVGGAGVAATCVPFVASMNLSTDVLAKAETEVDLTGIPVGGMRTVAWQGKPVFILHRTPEQIDSVKTTANTLDPVADDKRVLHPEWLVVVGVCTHMGCV